MFRRIRWRLLAAHLVVVLLALSFLGVHLARDSEARYLAQVETSLLAQARLIAVHVRDAVASRDITRTQAEFLGTQYPGNPSVLIVDRAQEVLVVYSDPSLRFRGSDGREGISLALQGRETSGSTEVNSVAVVYGTVPVRAGGSVVGAVYVALPLVELTAPLRHIRTFVGWTVLATILWAALVSLLLAQRIAGPIQEMRSATARMAAGALSERVPVRTTDELGDLARSLNYMAAELERLDVTRREFVADASHELRTPVANLAVAVEVLRGSLPTSDPGAAPLLDAIEREVERLRMLVENLLDLSAIESGRVQLHLVPTDLGELTNVVVESFRARAAQRGVTLERLGPTRGITVQTDPDRMSQVLSNLLDNALKFTPGGGRVSVSVTAHRDHVTVAVDDTGSGIPPDDLPHIFDRFFKADRSRSGQRGAGLGLAIAKRLMAAQGGEIRAENRAEGGARFVVTLPS